MSLLLRTSGKADVTCPRCVAQWVEEYTFYPAGYVIGGTTLTKSAVDLGEDGDLVCPCCAYVASLSEIWKMEDALRDALDSGSTSVTPEGGE